MENKIVKIRKLDDITENDWEINLDNGGKIYHTHKDFYEIVEKGMIPDKSSKAPTINETNPAMFFPKDEKEQREKEIVKKFRDDVKNLNGHEFNKKYHNKDKGDNVFDD